MPLFPSPEMHRVFANVEARETRVAALTAAAQSWAGVSTIGGRTEEILQTAREFERYIANT